jgi:signal transduction histidine kinase
MQKILVIDDEAPLRQLISLALQKRGFQTFEAANGEDGVQLARQHLPDLILSDVKMAKIDGYMTLSTLRHDPITAAIPFILMTGQPHSAGMRQGMDMGADDYLPKPFTISSLIAAVEARLKKQQALRQQAEQRLAVLRANISLALPHELFTPLSGIIGFAEIITSESSGLKPEELSEIGRAINTSAKRLYRLIENFLIYAQIELLAADPQKVAALRLKQAPNTLELIDSCAQQQAQLANRSADLKLELAPASAALSEDHLRKLIRELIDNAFKFSSPGSPVLICSQGKSGWLQISVRDHGRGMTAAQIADVGAYMQFERRLYEQQGSGLGLTIAKCLAELYGGGMFVQSEPNVGTCVTVQLPLAPTTPAPLQPKLPGLADPLPA